MCLPGATDPKYCVSPGVPKICAGSVQVRVQKKGTTISARKVTLNARKVTLKPDCTYRSRVGFRSNLRTRNGVLSFRARFQGNALLLPKSSATVTMNQPSPLLASAP